VWRQGLALLTKYDLSWDLRVPWYHLEEAAEVCREHRDLQIVVNHTGYPLDRSKEQLAVWKRGMEALASCPNVWCKISGLTVKGKPWTLQVNGAVIRETIGMFGVDRCMFASNFPVDSVKASWDWIYSQFKYVTAGLPIEDRRKLFAENALAFYRIGSGLSR
jgi:predicted TIM-barrel fold metal-dependent hydrolase